MPNPSSYRHRSLGLARGWKAWRTTGGRALGVSPVKGKQRIALVIVRPDGAREPVAYFHSREVADEVLAMLGDLALGQID